MRQIKYVEDNFKEFNLEILDLQMDDPTVGMFNGWVIYKDEQGNEFEISWVDAYYAEDEHDIFAHSIPYIENN